jgi:hypothetical protein
MRDLLTQVPQWVGIVCVIAGTSLATWVACWLHYQHRDADVDAVTGDRDQLLAAATHLLDACHDPSLNLDRAVTRLEKAIDGRWTP